MIKILLILLIPLIVLSRNYTVGSGGDYETLTLFIADLDDNPDKTHPDTGYVTDAREYAESGLVFDGKTTGSWTILGNGSGIHDGTFGSGAYITNDGSGHVVTISDNNVVFEDIEILGENALNADSDEAIRISLSSATGVLTIKRCIIQLDDPSTANCDGIYVYQDWNQITVENTVIYGWSRGGIYLQDYGGDPDIDILAVNCTLDENDVGFKWQKDGSGTQAYVAKNCVVVNGTYPWDADGGGTFTGDYNACDSDGASKMPGGNSITGVVEANEFESVGDDYHLPDALGDLYNVGIGPGSDGDIPTDDIDGDTRSGATADIGYDEFDAGAPPAPTSARRRFIN